MGSDLDRQIQTLLQCKIITEAEVKELCLKAREILVEESNVQRVDAPVTVCAYCDVCCAVSQTDKALCPCAPHELEAQRLCGLIK